MQAAGEADAFVSAGSTGAVMATSLFTLRPIRGVDRPAIGTVLPTSGAPCLLVDAGANVVTVHAEACRHVHRTVQQIHELGARAGVALNPGTPLCAVEEIAPDLDLLLVMSVNPGFGGQRYIEASTDKVRRAAPVQERPGPARVFRR